MDKREQNARGEWGDTVRIEAQGGVFKLGISSPPPGGGRRGVVVGFSPRARRHCLEQHERIDWNRVEGVTFLTVTFPRAVYRDLMWGWRRFEALMKRLERRHPRIWWTWKKEPHERDGVLHVHALVANLPFIPHRDLCDLWADVIGYPGRPIVYLSWENDSRRVRRYLAKYVGKVVPPSSLDRGSNSSAEGQDWWADWQHPGRWWGMARRERIPWARKHVVLVPRGDWVHAVRRLGRTAIRKRGRRYMPKALLPCFPGMGFTMLAEDASAWASAALDQALEEFSADAFEVLDGLEDPDDA